MRPETRPAITTSWDDGHPSDLRLAGLLRKYRLPATFYVPLSAPRGVLSQADIRGLVPQFEIGAHTVSHAVLTKVSDRVACDEITNSKSVLEQITGLACNMFCFPQGKFARRHLRMVSRAGFTGARTVQLLSMARPHPVDGVMVVPTTVQAVGRTFPALVRNCAKRMAWKSLLYGIGSRPYSDWLQSASQLIESARRRGGVFHLWGHSWEIDEHGEWSRLEDLFRVLASRRSEFELVTNGQLCRLV
jgi:peptidoglycan-N-acetylglucosamine deacetylase